MRFCDFFADYKAQVCSIKTMESVRELPLYVKIVVASYFLLCGGGVVLLLLRLWQAALVCFALGFAVLAAACYFDWKKDRLGVERRKRRKEYSRQRMTAMTKLLKEYGVEAGEKEKLREMIGLCDS